MMFLAMMNLIHEFFIPAEQNKVPPKNFVGMFIMGYIPKGIVFEERIQDTR